MAAACPGVGLATAWTSIQNGCLVQMLADLLMICIHTYTICKVFFYLKSTHNFYYFLRMYVFAE